MNLPEIDYPRPPMRWGLICGSILLTLVLAGACLAGGRYVAQFGAVPPPDNWTIARAVRDLEAKVEKLEKRVKELER